MYDAAVIGGGPAGSTAAYVLAREGFRPVVLEKDRFPRHHIGESLLPRTLGLYRRLDLLDTLKSENFVPKYGAHIVANDGSCEIEFDFFTGNVDPDLIAWQVERERFDQVLLDHARKKGAEVREGVMVLDVRTREDNVSVLRVRDGEGRDSEVEARWVVDASGQGSLLAKLHDLRVSHPSHHKAAFYARYRGMARREGRKGGNIDLILADGGWFWLIPLKDDVTSVGFVASTSKWKVSGLSAEGYLEEAVRRSPFVHARMKTGTRCSDIWTASNYSYSCRSLRGPGFVLVGDAAEFLDPIWSTGVMLAMKSGERAALDLARARRSGRPVSPEDFARYEKTFRRWTRTHFRMIEAYYDPGFAEVLFNRRNTLGVADAVTRLLAGQSEPGLLDRIRLRLFYWLIQANNKWKFLKDPRPVEHQVSHV